MSLFFLKKIWAQIRPLFAYFRPFPNTLTDIGTTKFHCVKAYMVCLGFEPGTAEWLARINPLSYGGFLCPCFLQQFASQSQSCKPFRFFVLSFFLSFFLKYIPTLEGNWQITFCLNKKHFERFPMQRQR